MRRAIAIDFAALASDDIKVVMTLDARLPLEPGPWRVESIAPFQHDRKLRELCRAADLTVLVAPKRAESWPESPAISRRWALECWGRRPRPSI